MSTMFQQFQRGEAAVMEMEPIDERLVSFEDDLGEDTDSSGEEVQVNKLTIKCFLANNFVSSGHICTTFWYSQSKNVNPRFKTMSKSFNLFFLSAKC